MLLVKTYQVYNKKQITLFQFHKKPENFQTVGCFGLLFSCWEIRFYEQMLQESNIHKNQSFDAQFGGSFLAM